MVEIQKNYQIGVRRFGYVNYIGMWSLYKKEVLRFLNVIGQTILGPIITSALFLLVISLAIGDSRSDVLGVPYINFLFPGLIAMQVIGQAFSHSSSSLLMGKVMGNIVDTISAPLSAAEVTFAIVLASVTRSSFILGAGGFITGLWAEKFDHMSSVTNFFIVPLSFLSGTFYSVERLPHFLQLISEYNPFFYMIDGFRYGFIGKSDGSITFGLIYLSIISVAIWFASYYLYKKGYKIKS